MRVQDLDSLTTANSTDELIVTNPTTHKSWRQTLSNFAASIKELFVSIANLQITTLFKVTGSTELAGTTITGNVGMTGDMTITGDVSASGDVSAGGSLSVTGESTLSDDVTVTGDVTMTGNADITGNVEVTGNLEINGDITQRGSSYETHAEKVYTKDDKIILRDGAVSALGADEYAGFIAKHYDTQGNDGALVFDKNGEARVGDITANSDDTEPLLTRDEVGNMVDKAILVWDAANKKAVPGAAPNAANKVPVSDANGGFSWESLAINTVDTVQSGNMNPVTSNAVANNITSSVTSGSNTPISSGGVYTALNNYINQKQIRIDDTSGYALFQGFYTKTITNFFSTNGIDYKKVINIRQVNNGNDYYPYFFIAGNVDVLKIFKLANINNSYIDINVYYF